MVPAAADGRAGHAVVNAAPPSVDTAPPSAREMTRIAVGLTVVCLLASLILGGVYAWTEPAKARNIAAREQRLIGELLALPPDARVSEVRRYLWWRGTDLEVLYLTDRRLVRFSAAGDRLDETPLPEELATAVAAERDAWVRDEAGPADEDRFRYAGRFFVGERAGERAGYVVEGRSAGFKTWIRFFLALDGDLGLRGIEVIEHEEDPGLGAEITEPYFKHQFAGRDYDDAVALEVTKDPLPNRWRDALLELETRAVGPWLADHRQALADHPDIHAITGATISSVAVTDGVRRALGNFRQRMRLVEPYL